LKKILFIVILIVFAIKLQATHNRAGEISFVQTGPLTIKATITLYTKTSSIAADRDSIEIFWGDGSSEFLVRANGFGYPQPNDVKISYYVGSHTFPSRGTFTMSMWDPNRITSILNVNFPDSGNIPFYLETTFSFLNTQFQGENNSAVLLQAPIDIGCVGEIFKHNPNAFDIDGDSISYELIVPLQSKDSQVPNYKWPDAIKSGANNKFTFDNKTGDLFWDSPQRPGEYNVAFRINEYRNGVLITSMIRDMQILIVDNCKSKPPQLIVDDNRCILAGDTLKMKIQATDIDANQKVLINATGEPFESIYGKAFLENNNKYLIPPVNSTFTWETTCEHISKQFYQVTFKAMDNSISDNSGLIDLKSLKVKVSGKPPKNLIAKSINSIIELAWDYPYPCINSDKNYFKGFSIWRKEGSNSFEIDSCSPGLEGKGYQIIKYLTDENDGINYFFEDKNIERGKIYCYRVLAEFSRNTFNGFPYNPVQSLPSNEACELVLKDSPYLTKVSVTETNSTSGQIEINWIKPDISVFDTIKYPEPYRYELYRAEGLPSEDYILIDNSSFNFNNYYSQDTMRFLDKNLNTMQKQFKYIVKLYSNSTLHSVSAFASSVFLEAKGTDNKVYLSSNAVTPWVNTTFSLYKKNKLTDIFEFLNKTSIPEFTDTSVQNGQNYCYFIKSNGKLGSNDFERINNSQITCTAPKDNEKPCPLTLTVENNCSAQNNQDDIFNHLHWSLSSNCQQENDIVKYKIYFSKDPDSTFKLLYNINDVERFDTTHLSLDYAGCYYITAIDNSGNESEASNIVCAKNCPLYVLPNTFTPNGDQYNDLFIPIINRHIDKIDFKVYSQLGILVFETNNPDINWNGTTNSGRKLKAGTYYYLCQPQSKNNKLKTLKGFIEIVF